MKTLARSGALALALFAAAAPVAFAQTPPPAADSMFRATTLNLSAYGETKIAPDMATISLGVLTEAPTAKAAMQANARQMTQVIAALKRAGLEDRDIQTSQLNLSPQYRYVENKPPQLTGYQASNQVTLTVRELSRLGDVVDATVASGANQVQGVSFGLSDPTAAENTAREKAVQALEQKAALYARATGHRVNRLVSLSEGGGYSVPPPMPMQMMARGEAMDASSKIAPGELKVRIDVTGLYELSR
ncbi:MAG TPA: SIMPL domain-containing protein [Phenylobacterium sp.]